MSEIPKSGPLHEGELPGAEGTDELSEQLVAIQSALQDLRVVLTRGAQELARIRSVTPGASGHTVTEQAPAARGDDPDADHER